VDKDANVKFLMIRNLLPNPQIQSIIKYKSYSLKEKKLILILCFFSLDKITNIYIYIFSLRLSIKYQC